jgi:hypothetical protein
MAGSCDDAALSGFRRTHLETEDRFPICANVTMFQLWSPASLESTSHAGAWLHFIVMKHKWAANAKLFKRRFATPGLQAQKFASVRSITWRSFPNEQGACETNSSKLQPELPYSARELSLETFRQFFPFATRMGPGNRPPTSFKGFSSRPGWEPPAHDCPIILPCLETMCLPRCDRGSSRWSLHRDPRYYGIFVQLKPRNPAISRWWQRLSSGMLPARRRPFRGRRCKTV